MENAKFLIEKHFYKNPLFNRLNSAYECAVLLRLMQPMHARLVEYCYVQDSTLFFIIRHNVGLQELKHDNNIISIKGLLKILITSAKKEQKNSIFENVINIKFLLSKGFKKPIKTAIEPKPKTMAKGEFLNSCSDKILHQKFEELRSIIKGINAN